MKTNKILEVFYHGKNVGRMIETQDKRVAFQYNEEWIKHGFSISPLSLPLKNDIFLPNDRSRDRFSGLFGVFADSLPDSWGQLLFDRHLSDLGINREEISTIDRLAYIGHSGMGALEYHPAKESEFKIDTAGLNYDEIARECEKVLSSRQSDQLDILYQMGGSSGGTRPKILLSEEGRDWIIKFPAKTDPPVSGKREYDYSVCAKKCGISMTETALIPSSVCEGYFKTERFDRKNKEKVFTVTVAGLLEADYRAPSCDYGTLMKLTRMLSRDRESDKEQLFKMMCFNVASHNRDDHTKNFSFLYTENTGWNISPAYDITYSNTYWGEQTMAVHGKGKDISHEDLIEVGTDAGLSKSKCSEWLDIIEQGTKDLEEYIREPSIKTTTHVPFKQRLEEVTKNYPTLNERGIALELSRDLNSKNAVDTITEKEQVEKQVLKILEEPQWEEIFIAEKQRKRISQMAAKMYLESKQAFKDMIETRKQAEKDDPTLTLDGAGEVRYMNAVQTAIETGTVFPEDGLMLLSMVDLSSPEAQEKYQGFFKEISCDSDAEARINAARAKGEIPPPEIKPKQVKAAEQKTPGQEFDDMVKNIGKDRANHLSQDKDKDKDREEPEESMELDRFRRSGSWN